jgi:hypothetical protein
MNRALRASIFSPFLLAAISVLPRASESGESVGDTLSGVLSVDVKPGARPYLVVGELSVPPGITVKIAEGTIFLFESFAGLRVQGRLLAQGTPNEPIVFTSTNDSEWNPAASVNAAPFDWNGIDIDDGAIGTELAECVIRYSVYGITSQTGCFALKNVHFSYNGKADCTIKGERRIIDAQPYSYRAPEPVLVMAPVVRNKSTGFRTTIRYTGLALAVAGCAAGSWALSEYPRAQKRFDEINTPGSGGALLYTSADWDAAKRTRDRDLAALLLGWGAGVIGVAGIALTFTF